MLNRYAVAFFCLLGFVNSCAGQTPAAPSSVTGPTTPAELFALAAKQTDIRTAGSPPFKLTATFVLTDEDGRQSTGEYSEVWISTDRWRRDLMLGSYRDATSCVGGDYYRLVPDTPMDSALLDVISNVSPRVPAVKDVADVNRTWSEKSDHVGAVPVLKVARNPSRGPTGPAETYFFTPDHAYPLAIVSTVQNVVYAKFQSVSGRLVPFEVVTHYINSKRSVDLRITSLEATSNPPDDSLVVSGATKGKCSGDGHGQVVQGLIVSKVAPVYPPGARMAHVSGTVVLRITIGKTGEIKDVQVALSPRADLSESAVAAVRQYVYKPFLLDGVPIEVTGFITINYVSR